VSDDPIGPGESRAVQPGELAGAFHDAYVDYDTLRQNAEGTVFEGFIDVGRSRYRYRALIEGSTSFEAEDEQEIAGNSIGDVLLVDGGLIFEGNIPGRFRVHGPIGLTRVEVDQEASYTRRRFRWDWQPISK
jgi:hypothetical protein